MFNLQKHNKEAQIVGHEKMLREHEQSPSANDSQPIWEKELWRNDSPESITEDQWKERASNTDVTTIEKVFDEAAGYITHRSDAAELSVPSINVVVEKMRQNRLEADWHPEKKKHWSQRPNAQQQNGSLPKWKKNFLQHDEEVLNNDPERFEGVKGMPVHWSQPENDADRGKSNDITPLVGNITKADVHHVADQIKAGASIDHDNAILALLKNSEKEKRELTPVECQAISDLKIARTKALLANDQDSK